MDRHCELENDAKNKSNHLHNDNEAVCQEGGELLNSAVYRTLCSLQGPAFAAGAVAAAVCLFLLKSRAPCVHRNVRLLLGNLALILCISNVGLLLPMMLHFVQLTSASDG